MAKNTAGFGTAETDEVAQPTSTMLRAEDIRIQTFELQDLSRRLPIGFFLEGERLQAFELNPYTTQHDLMLSQRSNEDFHIKLGRFLPQIVKSVGGHDVKDIAKGLSTTPELLFQRSYLADLFTIVLNIRMETVGHEIAIADQCRRCGTEYKDTAETGYHNLGECEVGVAINLSQQPIVEIQLPVGFEEMGRTVRILHMQPFKAYQNKDLKKVPEEKMEIAMMQKMICGMPELPEYDGVTNNIFTDDHYRRLDLKDRDLLLSVARKLIKLGPQMAIETQCEACKFKGVSYLPWFQLRQFCSEPASAAE